MENVYKDTLIGQMSLLIIISVIRIKIFPKIILSFCRQK